MKSSAPSFLEGTSYFLFLCLSPPRTDPILVSMTCCGSTCDLVSSPRPHPWGRAGSCLSLSLRWEVFLTHGGCSESVAKGKIVESSLYCGEGRATPQQCCASQVFLWGALSSSPRCPCPTSPILRHHPRPWKCRPSLTQGLSDPKCLPASHLPSQKLNLFSSFRKRDHFSFENIEKTGAA